MKFSLYVIIAVLLGSCSISEDVVQDGPFQKRKYFKRGWFFDRPLQRGMEVLDQDETELADDGYVRDPYLQMIPVELAALDPIDRNALISLDLLAEEKEQDRSQPEVHVELVRPVNNAAVLVERASDPSTEKLPDRKVAAIGSSLMITGSALLIPVALLLALVLIVQRVLKNDNGSTAAMVALLIGLVGLAALAVI